MDLDDVKIPASPTIRLVHPKRHESQPAGAAASEILMEKLAPFRGRVKYVFDPVTGTTRAEQTSHLGAVES